jgi:hypothetical protein
MATRSSAIEKRNIIFKWCWKTKNVWERQGYWQRQFEAEGTAQDVQRQRPGTPSVSTSPAASCAVVLQQFIRSHHVRKTTYCIHTLDSSPFTRRSNSRLLRRKDEHFDRLSKFNKCRKTFFLCMPNIVLQLILEGVFIVGRVFTFLTPMYIKETKRG